MIHRHLAVPLLISVLVSFAGCATDSPGETPADGSATGGEPTAVLPSVPGGSAPTGGGTTPTQGPTAGPSTGVDATPTATPTGSNAVPTASNPSNSAGAPGVVGPEMPGPAAGGTGPDDETDVPEPVPVEEPSPRTRVSLNAGWRFTKNDPSGAGNLSYAQTRTWVLPTGNDFVRAPERRARRPEGNLGSGIAYIAAGFDDSGWAQVDLPHDYAIDGPYTNDVSSSMGRLPSPGVSWYRKKFVVPAEGAGQSVSLELDGAMQYSLVWVNGEFVGGWPYGYASFRLDLTDVVRPGEENVVAVRLDTPVPRNNAWDSGSSRWYPGAGIYRNVWLTTTAPIHVAHWGTFLTTPEISSAQASIALAVDVVNDTDVESTVSLTTKLYELDADDVRGARPVAELTPVELVVPAESRASARTEGALSDPKLWGVPPTQQPNRYLARTEIRRGDELLDVYDTPFGVRSIAFDGDGFVLNGERLDMDGVCLHHDLGPLGAAANVRARERQLEIMQEMGSNAIRTAHNPFEPEFYDLADRMGFLVMNEAFDVWASGKTEHDHHVFFEDWHEQDLRALIRRDRNHPSIVMWSTGNEISEQTDDVAGPARARALNEISHQEDPTRPTVSGMNRAEPSSPFSVPFDTIGLNYQGAGVRDRGAQYPTYRAAFPNKFIVGTETTSTFSTRGTYLFPVTTSRRTPASGTSGVNAQAGLISSYDLYHADWSYTPDEEFEAQDKWPYVGGEFVWTGIDYLGEPTPLDAVARSSYFGIVDLAGFKKDRFYLYQARWRSELPMAHILPHWTWPNRVGQVTPVHVYTSGDSAELFVNSVSQGRKSKGQYEYRLRWDDVVYQPGELRVVAFKDGAEWATASVETVGAAAKLELSADRERIAADRQDLSFVTLRVLDAEDRFVPEANLSVTFELTGSGAIVATDNGSPTDRTVFSSPRRTTFNGMALAIVRAAPNQSGQLTLSASASGVSSASVTIAAD